MTEFKNQTSLKALGQNPTLSLQLSPVPGIDFDYIGRVILILLVLYIISAVFIFIQQYLMAGVAHLKVPLLAEVGVGPNWEKAH